jgi:hypothetical protein
VVCILNKRTAIFFYDSVPTRRKFAAKEDDEERPAESSEMDLDTIRSHIGPKQVLSTGRNPWWPINPRTWAASSIRGGSVIRNPFSTLSCSPSAHVLPSFLLCFPALFFSAASVARNLYVTPRKSPPPEYIFATRRRAFGVCNFHFSANSIPRSFVAAGSSLLPASLVSVSAKISVRCGRGRQILD